MGRIHALPHGAADTVPHGCCWRNGTTGWSGRKGPRCAATQMGPIPGPPPPCGMQKVLCRFRWHRSAPMSAGRTRPTWAFMFAPSMYTCPPCACTISQISRMDDSNTPCVDGYVIIRAASVSLCSAALPRRSSTSMFPRASDWTGTTVRPAMTALGGCERQVARLEPLDVAQHLGLGAIPVEYGMREVRRGAAPRVGDGGIGLRSQVLDHERQNLVE